MTFIEMLRNRWQKANSMVCVGLDSEKEKIPGWIPFHPEMISGWPTPEEDRRKSLQFLFNRPIVGATVNFVCAYKPNTAFYEGKGREGWEALHDTVDHTRAVAPDVPVILDGKRTDIGNTNKGYAEMAFDLLKADAVTVNPYFGGEALKPFLDRADKGVIVLCRTSNPGAKEFQDIEIPLNKLPKEAEEFFVGLGEEWTQYYHIPLYQFVAYKAVKEWNKNGNVLLVVGATYPDELRKVRKIVGDVPILVPGIGAQKGDLEATVKAGLDSTGFGMIINSARGIIFASKEGDFAEVAGREAEKLRDQINEIKASIMAR